MLSPKMKRTGTTSEKTKKPEPTSILSLPHELLLSCIARVSRLYYPTLSLVSKRFRSLISSPELYKARSVLGKTESCLYLCMRFYRDQNPTWFTLCLKPNQTLTNCAGDEKTKEKNKSSAYVLAKVPIPNSPTLNIPGLVSVGSCIYNIGANRAPLFHHVSVLDCRSHTWRDSPSLPIQLTSLTANVIDGKIYVAGCYDDDDDDNDSFKNCFQVFDISNGIWEPEAVPCLEAKEVFYNSKNVCIDGKFHVKTGLEVVAYSPDEGRWSMVGDGDGDGMRKFMMYLDSYCVIGNVLYSVFEGVIRWYDTKVSKWRYFDCLGGLLPEFRDCSGRVRLADYGGKMVVLWEEFSHDESEKIIWCAEIEIVRSKKCEILGVVEWFDRVLTLPLGYDFVKVISVTV